MVIITLWYHQNRKLYLVTEVVALCVVRVHK